MIISLFKSSWASEYRLPLSDECVEGMMFTWYSDEFWNSKKSGYPTVINYLDFSSKASYHSTKVYGSFCPQEDDYYDFKARGKVTLLLEVNWQSEGSAGWLIENEKNEAIENMYLERNKCYYIQSKVRSGSGSHQFVHQFWFKKSSDSEWNISGPLVACSYTGCSAFAYGQNCKYECDSYCHENGIWGILAESPVSENKIIFLKDLSLSYEKCQKKAIKG